MDRDFFANAACRDAPDPRIFHPDTNAERQAALDFCAVCEIREQCLQFGKRYGMGYGVWGGKDLTRRRKTSEPGANRDRGHTQAMTIAEARFRRTIADMGGKVVGPYRASYLPVAVICPHGTERAVRPDNAGRQAMCRCPAKRQYFA